MPYAKHRNSDNRLVGVTSTDPGEEAGFTVKNTSFAFPVNWYNQTWEYVSDGNYSKIDDFKELPAYQIDAVTPPASFTPDAKNKKCIHCEIDVSQNITINRPDHDHKLEGVIFAIKQDATGGHSVTFDSNVWKLSAGTAIDTAPNGVTIIQFMHLNDDKYYRVSLNKDYV